MSGGHVYVDESKARDYLLVAAVLAPDDLAKARRLLKALVMPGQRRLHMKRESNARRGAILHAITASGATATVYNAGRASRNEREARQACLQAVVLDAAGAGHRFLFIEQDDSLVGWERQRLIEITRAAGCRDVLQYQHRRAEHDVLLAIPDAIAWSWARGEQWRRRVQPLVASVRQL
ncbi:hypothetical protein BJY21_004390 [Kineosphaera limosa]|uniref:DUF3800 domain-containing protein n=1 Tax=Kineosphaera limosa NBRC 100340 TaxID=1184609 RepID=K6VEA7_9MICO|nr:hypothetical protein [Kineosphaera limosa]NYE03206.1 hypothetical protein [Kineosphaera limosa]GAB94543.1 hypothetical protein KILIM_005_01600 [Kineosphaera limosa NBRC 100340]